MALTQSVLDELRQSHGAESVPGTPPSDGNAGEVPYGLTLVGAIGQLERIAEHMDEYDLTYSDLTPEKQGEFDRAHEAFQYHVANLTNLYTGSVVEQDSSIELPNGHTVSLPKKALSGGSSSSNIPSPPSK